MLIGPPPQKEKERKKLLANDMKLSLNWDTEQI